MNTKTMHVYLDINGVLITDTGQAAHFADEFLTYILSRWPDTTYWLTTYCWHGENRAVEILRPVLKPATVRLLKSVTPAAWERYKTEAFMYREPFLWFDDKLYPEERTDLETAGALECWRPVNLAKDPNQLIDEIAYLQTIA